MNKKIKFKKENASENKSASYKISNEDIYQLKKFEDIYTKIILNINNLTFKMDNHKENPNYTLIQNVTREQLQRLDEIKDLLILIIKMEKENMTYKCPALADYL